MLKMTVYIGNTAVMEQIDKDCVIASFFHNPQNVLDTVEKQGWYGVVNGCYKEDLTFYKVVKYHPEENG